MGRRPKHHRPIAAENDSVLAESMERMTYVGCNVIGSPVLQIGFRDDSADLADGVRQCGENGHLLPPRIEFTFAYIRFPDVVEDELRLWALPDEFDRIAELQGAAAEVAREPIFRQNLRSLDKSGLETKGRVRLTLCQSANAFDVVTNFNESVEIRANAFSIFERRPSDNPFDP